MLCSVSVAQASPAPPIDAAALAAYAHGHGTISGSTDFGGAVDAFCAPDIPYIAWYVEERKRHWDYYSAYDSQLTPYTHHAQVAKDRTFTCEGLSSGRYLVWVEGYTPDFRSPPATYSRQREDSISGQVDPNYYTVTSGGGGSSPQLLLVGPEHVVVTATGTTSVTL